MDLEWSPRAYTNKINSFLREKEFELCMTEHGVYARRSRNEMLISCLYVDDMLITSSCKKEIEDFKH